MLHNNIYQYNLWHISASLKQSNQCPVRVMSEYSQIMRRTRFTLCSLQQQDEEAFRKKFFLLSYVWEKAKHKEGHGGKDAALLRGI